MKQRALERIARLLWPFIRTFVLIEIEQAKQDSIAAQAEQAAHRKVKAAARYIGEP